MRVTSARNFAPLSRAPCFSHALLSACLRLPHTRLRMAHFESHPDWLRASHVRRPGSTAACPCQSLYREAILRAVHIVDGWHEASCGPRGSSRVRCLRNLAIFTTVSTLQERMTNTLTLIISFVRSMW